MQLLNKKNKMQLCSEIGSHALAASQSKFNLLNYTHSELHGVAEFAGTNGKLLFLLLRPLIPGVLSFHENSPLSEMFVIVHSSIYTITQVRIRRSDLPLYEL